MRICSIVSIALEPQDRKRLGKTLVRTRLMAAHFSPSPGAPGGGCGCLGSHRLHAPPNARGGVRSLGPGRASRRRALVAALSLLACSDGFAQSKTRDPSSESRTVSFRNDVMAVLSKAGCNAGACHGNKNGKGGFKLSLRGEDPARDWVALSREFFGRRANPSDPDASLILLKSTTQLPHEGGLRFGKDSLEYDILRRWIAAGMPGDDRSEPALKAIAVEPGDQILEAPAREFQLKVQARFSDGSARDVTRLAVYDSVQNCAKISPAGKVEKVADGETTILVRYLGEQVPVRVAFINPRAGFQWRG